MPSGTSRYSDFIVMIVSDFEATGWDIHGLARDLDSGANACNFAYRIVQHGHPVIFGASLFAVLRNADPSLGARAVLREDPSRVRNLEVDDPGVLRDIDLPDEYRRLFDQDSR